jgi:hypothetical protein
MKTPTPQQVEVIITINKILQVLECCQHPHLSESIPLQDLTWCNLCGALLINGTWLKPHWLDIIKKVI